MFLSSSNISNEKSVAMDTLFLGHPGHGNRFNHSVHRFRFMSTISEALEPASTGQMRKSAYFAGDCNFVWRYVYLSVSSQRFLLSIIEALNALFDWMSAGLPIVFLWKCQMNIKVKGGTCVLMGMGFL